MPLQFSDHGDPEVYKDVVDLIQEFTNKDRTGAQMVAVGLRIAAYALVDSATLGESAGMAATRWNIHMKEKACEDLADAMSVTIPIPLAVAFTMLATLVERGQYPSPVALEGEQGGHA